VRINKRINRREGENVWYKYGITIPNSVMSDLDWDETTPVNIEIKNGKIVISRL
jgi:hypothetical protein